MRKQKAITLISLVITIVVLIILASVGIYLSLGNNGIFTRAKQAKETTNKQTATEIINLKITTAQMNKYAEEQRMPTLKELSLVLGEDNEIQYVTETSKVASTEYSVGENPTSIYTKLNKYPYEFEINSSLQLASINGVKVANNEQIYLFDYSKNEEKVVGKWRNGKNVYEKFWDLGNATQYGVVYNSQNANVEIPVNNICNNLDEVIKVYIRGEVLEGNSVVLPFAWTGDEQDNICMWYNTQKKILGFHIGYKHTNPKYKDTNKFQAIIQYTKTDE